MSYSSHIHTKPYHGHDFLAGARLHQLWLRLASHDIKLRYRGSVLGPFWITLTTLVMICTVGLLFSKIFKQNPENYLPMFALGLIFWHFISAMVVDGSQLFISYASVLNSSNLPYSVQIYRMITRNILILGHNLIIVPPLILYFDINITWSVLLFLPAIILVCINGFWFCVLFGMLSAKFRDVPQIVINVMQVAFFLTPIFWDASMLGHYKKWVELNPLFSFVDILRSPLMGDAPSLNSWSMVIFITVTGSFISHYYFRKYKSKINYWLL